MCYKQPRLKDGNHDSNQGAKMMPIKIESHNPTWPLIECVCPNCRQTFRVAVPTSGPNFVVVCWNCRVEYNQDSETLCAGNMGQKTKSYGFFRKNKDTARQVAASNVRGAEESYYELLGISREADPSEIKRAYYSLAIKFHPDKNPGKPECEEQFKKITRAYQVLSDPKQRTLYDKYGDKGDEMDFDARAFFCQHFGGSRFVDLIGEISLAAEFEQIIASDGKIEMGEYKKLKESRNEITGARVKTLAENLLAKLALLTETEMNEEDVKLFTQCARVEVAQLRQEVNGAILLKAIGYCYCSRAKQYFGGISGYWQSFKEKGHIFSDVFSFLRAGISLKKSVDEMEKATTDEAKAKLEAQMAEKGMEALWLYGKCEIETVLREVCDFVLIGEATSKVPRQVALKRAFALHLLGEIFQE